MPGEKLLIGWNHKVLVLFWLGAMIALLAPLVLGLSLAYHSLADLDIWLHDRAGQDILTGNGIPRTNTYSFTAPRHIWVDHEWLFQVTVASWGGGGSPAEKANKWNLLRLLMVAVLLVRLPSLATKVKLSTPAKPASGV